MKTVTITIEVPMDSEQCQEWRKPSDYFNESVKAALEKISEDAIKNLSGEVKTDTELSTFKVSIKTQSK
jgi:hypothetical protein